MVHRFTGSFSWQLLFVIVLLLAVGMLNLYSAVFYWEEGGSLSLFWNQLIWIAIGFALMTVFTFIDYRILKQFSPGIYVFVIILLMVAAFFGSAVRGTRGWLQFGSFNFQPAELAKIAYILMAARYFSDNPSSTAGYGFAELWRPALLMMIPCGVIVYQGDMGSAFFLICIFASLALFVKVRRSTLIACLLIALLGGAAVYNFGLKEYQRDRIFTFLHPEADIKGTGYHLMQSKIAVGSGKFLGKGYLKGNINKLRYLPERHTDFIFPVLAEEWGFAGCAFVLFLQSALLFIGIEISRKARDRFGIFLAMGIVAMIFWQLVINLGGVLGLIPLTGVTLPFLSYGGSSIIVTLLSMGLLFSVSLRRNMF